MDFDSFTIRFPLEFRSSNPLVGFQKPQATNQYHRHTHIQEASTQAYEHFLGPSLHICRDPSGYILTEEFHSSRHAGSQTKKKSNAQLGKQITPPVVGVRQREAAAESCQSLPRPVNLRFHGLTNTGLKVCLSLNLKLNFKCVLTMYFSLIYEE